MTLKILKTEPNSWNAEAVESSTVRSFPRWFDKIPLARYLFSNERLPAYDRIVVEKQARKLGANAVFEDNHLDIGDYRDSLTYIKFYRKV